MKDRNEKHEKIRNTFDEIIKAGYSLPPDDMYDRIINSCKAYDNIKSNRCKHKKITWKKVLIIAAVIVIALAMTLNVSAVKVYIFQIINQLTSDTIKIEKGTEAYIDEDADNSDETYLKAEEQIGVKIQKPRYLPDDMNLEEIRIYGNKRVRANYFDGDKHSVILEITVIDKDGVSSEAIDTDYSETFTKTINGKLVQIYYYNRENAITWINAMWNDDNAIYEIKTNLEQSILDKIIEGFKY